MQEKAAGSNTYNFESANLGQRIDFAVNRKHQISNFVHKSLNSGDVFVTRFKIKLKAISLGLRS